MQKYYSADFETSVWDKNETWVWAWCFCEVGNEENLKIGNSIESFIFFISLLKNPIIYFHNLKFDGEFIISYLLNNGFELIENKKLVCDNSFTCLLSGEGAFYEIVVYLKVRNKSVKKITFRDSLKLIPFPVRNIPKAFNIPEVKLSIDYLLPREKGHVLTEEEKEYIKADVIIVSKALKIMFENDLNRLTIGSCALREFKKMSHHKEWARLFPTIDSDNDYLIRKSYKRRVYLFKSKI